MATLYFKVKADYEEVQKLNEEIRKLKDTLRDTNFSGSTSELVKQLEEATKKMDALVSSAAKTGAELKKLAANAKSIADASSGIGGMQTKMTQATKGASDLSHSLRETHRTMQQLRASTDGVTMNLGNFIKNFTMASAAVAAFHKVTGTIKDAMGTIVSFEAANSTLRAIAGATEEELAALTEQALELGRKTVFTASQVTQLETELAKLGFRASEIIDMSEGVLYFAQSTGANLADAASTAGAALKMFGAQSEETMRYVSAMSAATRMSALNFQAISDNLATFGPMAHTMGMEIEDVLALFGKLKDAGIEGSTAMTSLRNIFTKVSQGKIEGMGKVNSLDDFVEGVKRAQEALGGDVGKAMKMIGPRGGTQFMSLIQAIGTVDMQTGKDSVTALRDRIKEAAQSTEGLTGMAGTMSNNVAGSIKMMQSAWEGFVLQFSEASGPVKEAVDLVTTGITAITEAIKGENAMGKFFDSTPVKALTSAITGTIAVIAAYKASVAAYGGVVGKVYASQVETAAKAMADYSIATNAAIDADLKDAYAKGILTKEQAESIATSRLELQAMRSKVVAENQLLQAKIQTYRAYAMSSGEQTRQILLDKAEAAQKKITANNTFLDATANVAEAKSKGLNTRATMSLKGAMDSLKRSMLTNPYFLLLAAITALGAAIYKFATYVSAAEQAQTKLNEIKQKHIELMQQEKSEAQSLATALKDGNKSIEERYEAYRKLMELLGKYDFNDEGERIGFKGMSYTDMSNLSSNEIQAIIERGVRSKNEDSLRKRADVYKELSESGDYQITEKELRLVLSKNNITDQGEIKSYIEELKSIDVMTSDSKFYENMLKGINGQMEELRNNSRAVSVIENLNKVLSSTTGDVATETLQGVNKQMRDVQEGASQADELLADYHGSYEERKNAMEAEVTRLKKERELTPKDYVQKTENGKQTVVEKDTSNTRKANALDAEIKRREAALKKLKALEAKFKGIRFDVSDIDTKIEQLQSKRGEANDATKKEIDKQITDLKSTKTAVEQAQKIINSGSVTDVGNVSRQFSNATQRNMTGGVQDTAAKAYDAAIVSLEKYESKIRAITDANKGLKGSTGNVIKGLQDLKISSGDLKDLDAPYKKAKAELDKLQKELEKAKKSGKLSLDKKLEMEANIKGLQKTLKDIDTIRNAAKECTKDPVKMQIIVDYIMGKPLAQVRAEAEADANIGKKKRDLKKGEYFWGDDGQLLKVAGRDEKGRIIPRKTVFKSEGADIRKRADQLDRNEENKDNKDTSESAASADELRKLNAQRKELLKKQQEERAEYIKGLTSNVRDKGVAVLKNGDKKTEEQAKVTLAKENEAIDKKIADRIKTILGQGEALFNIDEQIASEKGATKDGKKKVKGARKYWGELSDIEKAEYVIDQAKKTGGDAGIQIVENNKGEKVIELSDNIKVLYERLKTLTKDEFYLKINGLDEKSARAMNDYLAKYGNFNERRAAVEDNLKLDQENMTESGAPLGDYLSRTQSALDEMRNIKFEELKDRLNWEEVFTNLEMYSETALVEIKRQLHEYLNVGDVDAENAEIITSRLNEIDNQLNKRKSVWRDLFSGNGVANILGKSFDRKSKIREYEDTYNTQTKLKEKFEKKATQDKNYIYNLGYRGDYSKGDVQNFFNAFGNVGKQALQEKITSLFQNQAGAAQADKAAQAAQSGMQAMGAAGGGAAAGGAGAAGGAAGAAGGGAGAVAIVDAIVHGINDNVQSLNKFLDKLEVNREEGFGYTMNEFARASQGATDAWESLKSGDAVGVVSGIWDSIDGLIAIFDRGNVAEMRRAIERATESIENFAWAIDKFVEDISDSPFSGVVDSYETAEKYQKVIEQKEQQMLADTAATWKHGSHGFGYKFARFGEYGYDDIFGEMMDKGYLEKQQKGYVNSWGKFIALSDEEAEEYEAQWRGITRADPDEHILHYDTSRGAQDKWLASLSAEQWEDMRKNDPELYSKIQYNLQRFAKDNEGLKEFAEQAANSMDTLSEIPAQLEQMYDALNKALLGFSKDSIVDDFASALTDMTSDSETFASNFEEMMRQAVVASLSDNYKPQLEALYKRMAETQEQHSKDGTSITAEEIASYRQEYTEITESARKQAQAMYEMFGIDNDYQQGTASTREVRGITSDQADILNGRVSAISMTIAQVQGEMISQGMTMTSISSTLLEKLDLDKRGMIETQGIREDMAKAYLELVDIRNNTQISAEFLEIISDYIRQVKENTDRL